MPNPPPITVSFPLAWAEMDAFGHVNNILYFRYFEIARIEYARRVGLMSLDVPPKGVGPILHSVNCRFRIPVTFPDTLDVTARLVSMEADRITLAHQVLSRAHKGAVAAEGSGVIVAYDYSTRTKAAIPGHVREAILALEAAPPAGL